MSSARIQYATQLLEQSAAVLRRIQLGDNLLQALGLIEQCRGRVIVTGIGKSGIVAHKIAATLSSLARPSYFLNAGEASHGDMGMIARHDCVILVSNSGNTIELEPIMLYCRRYAIPTIAIVGSADNELTMSASVSLCYGPVEDPCVGAPTISALAALAVGDIIASCLSVESELTVGVFQQFHPGGELGSRK